MTAIWYVLLQFLGRLTLGVALAMGLTSTTLVSSSFFRVHLWMLLGMHTLAALALASTAPLVSGFPWKLSLLPLIVLAAVLSYIGSVFWLYERPLPGKVILWLLVLLGFLLATGTPAVPAEQSQARNVQPGWAAADALTGGLLMGTTLTAMLLGHWYLNWPGMKLLPLQRLLLLLMVAILLRALFCGTGLALQLQAVPSPQVSWWLFVLLRWLAGVVGASALAVLAWQTLKVPNTQSATGILYAAVILVFIGELTSQLLSSEALYPL